jgi:hypothetical protein
MNSKMTGGSIYEAKVLRVDSMRIIRRFIKKSPYATESRDSTDGSIGLHRTQYAVTFQIVRGVAGAKNRGNVPLIGVDSRPMAKTVWERIWPSEKRYGKLFIVVLENNGQIRATYLAESRLGQKDSFEIKMREAISEEMMAISRDTAYRGYLDRKNYFEILKRENFIVE